ncbi:MAG: thioredoxin domain-containing protein [Deltaproteobacteria bacterium]|nr:thioredoxin domain-containing protein [Deltaproteobacteria bacterium]
MKNYKNLCVAVLFCTALSITGCSGSSETAATVNGKKISYSDLDAAFGGRVGKQIYETRKRALDSLIDQTLVEQAAAEKKLSVEDFMKQEVEAGVQQPSEEEIKAIYDANKDRFEGSFEEAKATIADSLKRNRQTQKQNQLIDSLHSNAKIDVKLPEPPVTRVEISADNDPFMGPENAPVTIIEFSDFQCPFCGRARPTINQILETYKDKVKFVFRDFPLSFHKDAFKAHEASHCANDQGKFWDYYKKLFESQTALGVDNLKKYASEMGLDSKQFDECLASGKHTQEVQNDVKDGAEAGVSGTPAFFVNGIMLSGAQPFASFKELIDKELKTK